MESTKQHALLILTAAFLLLVNFYDYTLLVAKYSMNWKFINYLISSNIVKIFYENGYIFRASFLLTVAVISYNFLISLKIKEEFSRTGTISIVLIGLSITVTAYIFITKIGLVTELMLIVYPFLALINIIGLSYLMKILSTRRKMKIDNADLSCWPEKTKDPDTFYFETDSGGYINIRNSFQGILVIGSAGSGKTASVAIPMINQIVKNKWTGIIYDYKNFALTKYVYSAYQYYGNTGVRLGIINFTDPAKSNRINPIDPKYIYDEAFIDEYVSTIMKNLNKNWIKKSDFFSDSAMLLLKAIIIFMYRKHPEYCTIPHVFHLINSLNTENIVEILKHDKKAMNVASSVSEAVEKNAMEQVSGVIASLKKETQKLDNPIFYWILSGDDFSLELNKEGSETLLCLVNNQQKEETIAPIISLIVTVARKLMNTENRKKSVFLLDEAPTLFLPNFDTLPATARSNKVVACVMCQDISQLDDMYTKTGREKIFGSLGNTFYGNCSSLPSQEYVSKQMGREDKIIENETVGKNKGSGGSHGQSDSISYNVQERTIIKTQDVGALRIGEFLGKIIGEEMPYYKSQFKMLENYEEGVVLKEEIIPDFSKDLGYDDIPSGLKIIEQKEKPLMSYIKVNDNYEKIDQDIITLKNKYCFALLNEQEELMNSGL